MSATIVDMPKVAQMLDAVGGIFRDTVARVEDVPK